MAEDKIIDRIRKMLAIANDERANEGERDNALRMAYNLLAKHNLSLADVETRANDKAEPRTQEMFVGWSQPWARTVYASVAKLFFCHYCYGEKLNATKQQHYFTGKASNVLTAQLMGDYLVASILRECRKLYTHNLDPRSRAFATGAASRLWSRVLELVVAKQRELSEESESRALVLASLYDREDSANRAHLQELGINVTTEKSRASANLNARAFAAGSEYANTVGLDLQLEKDADKPQLR